MSTQYLSITGPLTTDQPKETYGWSHVSHETPIRRKIAAALVVAACAFVPVVSAAAPLSTFEWARQQPEPVRFKRIHTSSIASGEYRSSWIEPPADGIGGRPTPGTGSLPILQYQGYAGPFFVPPPDNAGALTSFPAKLYPRRALHVSSHPAWVMDRFAAPAAAVVPDLSWQGRYADRINPRKGLRHSLQLPFTADTIQVPQTAPAPDSSWQASYPARISQRHSPARFVWAQPHFAYITQVPVMSWTGLYLDPPVIRKSHRALRASGMPELLVHSLVATSAPANSWTPVYPNRIDPRPRKLATFEAKTLWSVFTSDITVQAPDSSWQGRYEDIVHGKPALHTSSQQAFFFDRFDAPDEVVAPDLSAAVYSDIVPGKRRTADLNFYVQPIYITDITEPAPANSWQPVAPDYIVRLAYATSAQPVWTSPLYITDVTVVAPALSWQGEYPDYIWRKPLLHPSANPAFTFDAKWDAPPFIIGISARGTVFIVRTLNKLVTVHRTLTDDVEV